MSHRYRRNKIKREHTLLPGLLPALERIAAHPEIQAITPGRINRRAGNQTNGIWFQYRTETGFKLLARSNRAVQEVFVVTNRPDDALASLVQEGLVTAAGAAPHDDKGAPEERTPVPGGPDTPPPAPPQESRPAARRKRPSLEDALPGEVREKMLDLAQGRFPAESRAQNQREARRARAREAEAAPPHAGTPLWDELLRRHHALLALERSLSAEADEAQRTRSSSPTK